MSSPTFRSIYPPPPTKLSPQICQQLRALGLRLDSTDMIGRNLMFERCALLYNGCSATRLKIGAYSYSSYNSVLTTVSVGRYCSIGHAVEFGLGHHQFHGLSSSLAICNNHFFMEYSGTIPFNRADKRPNGEETSVVTLGHDIWVGCHCLFPKDVTIGHGAVIGAGSIITHDVPPFAIVAGAGGGERSKGIIKGYRFPDEVISDLLELNWWDYDIPKMMASGIKVPTHNIKDFITFMRTEEREHLIPLPEAWYYLNVIDANSVQVFRVDPAHTSMGSLIEPAQIAIIDDPMLAQAQAQLAAAAQAQAEAEAQARAAEQARVEAQERARTQAQAMMLIRQQSGT